MAAVLTNKNEMYKQAEFTVDTVDDISKLPTLTTGGTDELHYVEAVKQGSTAFVIANSAVYILSGDNIWKMI